MSSSTFPGPVAPESNPPINPQYYEPSRYEITNITLGNNTVVTTSVDHNYVIGQECRLIISKYYGSYQLNEQTGFVIAIPASNQVTLTIDSSSNVNSYISSPTYNKNPPQIMAIGDINTGAINSSGRNSQTTYIPGSFIDISPN